MRLPAAIGMRLPLSAIPIPLRSPARSLSLEDGNRSLNQRRKRLAFAFALDGVSQSVDSSKGRALMPRAPADDHRQANEVWRDHVFAPPLAAMAASSAGHAPHPYATLSSVGCLSTRRRL